MMLFQLQHGIGVLRENVFILPSTRMLVPILFLIIMRISQETSSEKAVGFYPSSTFSSYVLQNQSPCNLKVVPCIYFEVFSIYLNTIFSSLNSHLARGPEQVCHVAFFPLKFGILCSNYLTTVHQLRIDFLSIVPMDLITA